MKYPSQFLLSAAVALTSLAAQANITVNPNTGLTDEMFNWYSGVGPSEAAFDITVGVDSLINVSARDDFVAGDEFKLKLDGLDVSWTTAGYVGGYFQGIANGVFLSAGTHTFTIDVTAMPPDFTGGAAYASFSSVTPAVPEPATFLTTLMGLGIMGLIAKHRRAA